MMSYTLEVKTKIIDNKFLYLSFDKGKSYELVGTLENNGLEKEKEEID